MIIGYQSEIKSRTLGSTYEMFLTWDQWSHVWKRDASSGNMPGK